MSSCLTVINTRLPPRDGDPSGTIRSSSYNYTGLKPGVNENAFRKTLWFALVLLTLWLGAAAFAAQTDDTEFEARAVDYINTYLAAHPLQGTALGLHEYDGKITDYSRLSLDAELHRLRRFDDVLAKFDPAKLSPRQSIDLRILQAAVKKDLFEMQDMSIFERNPMVYAGAGDVNVYIKRNFAPLDDRVRSLAGAGETSTCVARLRARRRKIHALPGPDRAGRSAARKNSRDRNGAIKSRTGCVCRSREKDRPQQVADRSLQANPGRTSSAGQAHSRCRQRSGQYSEVRFEPSPGQHPIGRPREGQRDAAISAGHLICFDGHTGPIRET